MNNIALLHVNPFPILCTYFLVLITRHKKVDVLPSSGKLFSSESTPENTFMVNIFDLLILTIEIFYH